MTRTKWEYKTLYYEAGGLMGGKIDVSAMLANLNALGQLGWEVTGVLETNQVQGATRHVVILLKRPGDPG